MESTEIFAKDIRERNELLQELLLDEPIDFIAQAITPWQAIGVNAYVNEFHQDDVGIFIIKPHGSDGQLITREDYIAPTKESIFITLQQDISDQNIINQALDGFKSPFAILSSYLRNSDQPVSIITQSGRLDTLARVFFNSNVANRYYPKFVIVDKGYEIYLGDYLNSDGYNMYKKIEHQTGESVVRRVYDLLWESSVNAYHSETPVIYRNLFSKMDGVLEVNNDIKKQYLNVLPEISEKNDIGVILPPLSNSNKVPQTHHIEEIFETIEYLVSNGLRPVIKPHPRDNGEYFEEFRDAGGSLIDKTKALEYLLPELNPSAVFGTNSTALITAGALFDIPTYTYLDGPSPEYSNTTNEFLELSSRFVLPYRNVQDCL